MLYIKKLRQSLLDVTISKELGLPVDTVRYYTSGRSVGEKPEIKEYVVNVVREFLNANNK